ncbi:MAG: penicillin-binding transpeptidase domain-containing protein, partial [Minicystis sp.]
RAGVNEEGGTAFTTSKKAALINFDMAGKTGTAQVSHHLARGAEAERVWYFNREHAWFAGFAPVKSPEVAVVAIVEHGGVGGKHAAPIAFEAVRAYQEFVRDRREGARAGAKGPGGKPKTQVAAPGQSP